MRCNQCDSAYINGMFCHEHGCPNHDKEFIDGEWVTPEPEENEFDDFGDPLPDNCCHKCGQHFMAHEDSGACITD